MDILNILVIIAFVIIALFYKSYLTKYLDKKGENLATKEDVSEITKKIEKIKLEFASQSHTLVKKKETYERIVSSMQIFLDGHPSADKDKNQWLQVYSLAWLWANDEVLKKINDHLILQMKKTSNPDSVEQSELKESYRDCVLEMRKDCGYSNTILAGQEFLFVRF